MAVPQFKVFGAVIEPITVAVVDILTLAKRTTKNLLHHIPMFSNVVPPTVDDAVPVVRDVAPSTHNVYPQIFKAIVISPTVQMQHHLILPKPSPKMG